MINDVFILKNDIVISAIKLANGLLPIDTVLKILVALPNNSFGTLFWRSDIISMLINDIIKYVGIAKHFSVVLDT